MALKHVCDTTLFSFYQQHPEMEQLSTHYEQGHGLNWLEQAPKDLPEIFHLIFKSLGLSPFAKVLNLKPGLINNVYVQGGHTCLMWTWRKVAKSHKAADQ